MANDIVEYPSRKSTNHEPVLLEGGWEQRPAPRRRGTQYLERFQLRFEQR